MGCVTSVLLPTAFATATEAAHRMRRLSIVRCHNATNLFSYLPGLSKEYVRIQSDSPTPSFPEEMVCTPIGRYVHEHANGTVRRG